MGKKKRRNPNQNNKLKKLKHEIAMQKKLEQELHAEQKLKRIKAENRELARKLHPTVRSRVFRGFKKLRKEMHEAGREYKKFRKGREKKRLVWSVS